MQLKDKLVLVTGATGGIGRALCTLLSAAGARVVLNGLVPSQLDELRTQLGLQHQVVVADISTAAGREQLERTCAQQGGLDVLINLAGILDSGMYLQQSEASIARLMEVNALAPMLLTRTLLPQLVRKPQARIVNVGSTFGSIGHPGFATYCASKAAVKMFSEALARELADTPVSVGYIAPRATNTPLNSSRVRLLNQALGNSTDSPETVAAAVFAMTVSEERVRYLGWPESLFVRINALLPSLVHNALVKKLSLIKEILG